MGWRVFAGLLPGFFIAAGVTALLCWLPPGTWRDWLVPGIVAFIPLWMAAFATAFAFASPPRALLSLTFAALGVQALFFGLKALEWIA